MPDDSNSTKYHNSARVMRAVIASSLQRLAESNASVSRSYGLLERFARSETTEETVDRAQAG